jgi:hypothetical protein
MQCTQQTRSLTVGVLPNEGDAVGKNDGRGVTGASVGIGVMIVTTGNGVLMVGAGLTGASVVGDGLLGCGVNIFSSVGLGVMMGTDGNGLGFGEGAGLCGACVGIGVLHTSLKGHVLELNSSWQHSSRLS